MPHGDRESHQAEQDSLDRLLEIRRIISITPEKGAE